MNHPATLTACPACGAVCILLAGNKTCLGCKHKTEGTLKEAAAFTAKFGPKKEK